MNAILTEQGQVIIPQIIRDALGLEPGSRLEFDLDERGRVILRKADATATDPGPRLDRFDRARGRGRGRATIPWRTDDLMRLLRGDE